MHRTLLTAAFLFAVMLTACARTGSPTDAPAPSEPATTDRPAPSGRTLHTAPPSTAALVGEVPAEVLDPILTAAAERSGVARGDLEVIRAEQVTWSDGSLGCPEPGQMYTQALVDGYHVVIVAGDEELDYRVGSAGSFRLCESPLPRGG